MNTIAVSRNVDTLLAHLDQREARHVQEIAEAQAGVRAVVSRDAAARFLGLSTKTLYRLLQKGEGPPYEKREGGSRSQNERVYFPFPQLKAWKDAQTLYSSPEQRDQLREEAHRNDLRRQLDELERAAAALRTALRESGDRRIMAFDGLASLNAPHPWVFDGTRLLGHALIVSDDDLAAGELIWLALDEALLEDWVNLEQHEHFTDIFVGACNGAIQVAQSQHRRLRLRAEADKAHPSNDRVIRRDL